MIDKPFGILWFGWKNLQHTAKMILTNKLACFLFSGPPVSMTWLGHRRLTIANRNSAEVTVILLLTNYEQDFNMDNVKVAAACRKAFMSKGVEDLMLNTICLKYLLSNLASLIQLQKINEIPDDRSLLASPFMKSLVALSEVFSLGKSNYHCVQISQK